MLPAVDIRHLAIALCGLSAGVHLALVPSHLGESTLLAVGFAVAAALLVATAAAFALVPGSSLPPLAAAVLFAGLIVSWAILRHEPLDALAAATKALEAAGFAASLALLVRRAPRRSRELSAVAFGLPFVLALVLATGSGHAVDGGPGDDHGADVHAH